MIAHLDKNLYQELYAISKIRLCERQNEKWNQYNLKIDDKIYENVKKYVSVDR